MTRLSGNMLLLAFFVTGLLGFASPARAVANDVNGDGQIDVVDVQCVVLTILGPGLPDCLSNADAADLNCSGGTDVVDYQLMVLVVLAHPQVGIPDDKDVNNNNIHDDCEGNVDPVCGDNECNGDETCNTCQQDCGECLGYVPGDLIITEVMKDPRGVADVHGEWFEIRNMTTSPIDLKGWKLEDLNGESHTINPNPDLIAGVGGQAALVVLGNNGNPNTACGVDVDYAYTDFTLDNDGTDGIMLVAPDGTVIDEVFYNDVDFYDVPGYSLMLSPSKRSAELNDIGANWCLGWLGMSCEDWGGPGVVSLTCKPAPTCGNSTPEFGETCDDGNQTPGDGCSEKCQNETSSWCGNGDLEFGEACDDGNTEPFDGCSPYCQEEQASVCGNDIKEGSEECDDGNTKNGDGCDSKCLIEPGCGDGIIDQDAGEQCDPPNPPDCSAECKLGYTDPLCGDGYKHPDEQCDDGCMWGMAHTCEQYVDDGDGCSYLCELEGICGNGQIDGIEECDDGNNEPGDGCNENCLEEVPVPACEPSPCCGDWQLNPGEDCDDGNLDLNDGCDDLCHVEPVLACSPSPCCGDGALDDGEVCDDGNVESGDGCSATCASEAVCGDGKPVFPEECDDGNLVNGDGCDGNCQWESVCGDKKLGPPEECDDGNLVNGDGCSDKCLNEGQGNEGTAVLKGKVSWPGGAIGAQNTLYIGVLDGDDPMNAVPVGPFAEFNVTSLPFSYTVSQLPAGQYLVLAFLDVGADNPPGPNGEPGEPNEGDADQIYITLENPQKVTLVNDQETTGIDMVLKLIPPPPQ